MRSPETLCASRWIRYSRPRDRFQNNRDVMNKRTAGKYTARLILMTAAALVCLPSGSPAAEQRTASLLFLSSDTRQLLPAPEPVLRTIGESAITAALNISGNMQADNDVVGDLQIRHRVRSGQVIDRRFLDDLIAEADSRYLLVVQLMFESETIQPSGRLIDTRTGLLLDAGTVDPEPWTGDDWMVATDLSVTRMVARLNRHGLSENGIPFVVLPVQTHGIAQSDASTATYTLLETILADGRLRVTDPGLVNHLLIDSGADPRRIDAAGMSILSEALGATLMIKLEMRSYATQTNSNSAYLNDQSSNIRTHLPSFSYVARITDLKSGTLLGSASLYHDDRPVSGWFGIVTNRSSRSTLSEAAVLLWERIGSYTEEIHDQAPGTTRAFRGPASSDSRNDPGDIGGFDELYEFDVAGDRRR